VNPWQIAQQIKHELSTLTWDGGSGEVVFGPRSVFVYAGTAPDIEQHPPGFPFALITIDAGTPDPDDPDLIEQGLTIVTAVEVAGDPMGEFAVIGSSRPDLGKSTGAGVAEVAERVRYAIQRLTGYDGAAVVVSGSGTGAPQTLGDGRQIAFDQFNVTALCTSQPRYTAPQRFGITFQTMSWAGEWVTPRFDFLQFRVGYKAGTTPATSPDDCDAIIYTGSNTEYAEAVVAGRVYSVFADYNSRGGSAVEASSTADVGSYKVV